MHFNQTLPCVKWGDVGGGFERTSDVGSREGTKVTVNGIESTYKRESLHCFILETLLVSVDFDVHSVH